MNKLQTFRNISNILVNNFNIHKSSSFAIKLIGSRFPKLTPILIPKFTPVLNIVRCFYKKKEDNWNQVFEPSTVYMSNANKHLTIVLFDENDQNLGNMSFEKANLVANNKTKKLVQINENSPPEFKLMTGHELHQLQMAVKEKKKAKKIIKDKEVQMNLGIEEHDLDIKVKMIKNFYEKGHLIKIEIQSRILNKAVIQFD